MVFLTQIVFYGLPWLEWGNARWCCSIWAHGAFSCLAWCCIRRISSIDGAAHHLGLGAVFVHGGGWAAVVRFCLPKTVYTEIFMWIEHKVEGDRSALAAGRQPWTLEKV